MEGLNHFDEKTGSSRLFTVTDGLPHNGVQSLVEDDEGYIWIGTSNGLSKFDPKTERFKNYYKENGIINNTFIETAGAKSQNGDLYFGTQSGVVFFSPDAIGENTIVPKVVLTGFQIEGEEVGFGVNSILKVPISVTKSIELPHHLSNVSFTFSGLHFANPALNQYAYRMDNQIDHWLHIGKDRKAVFSNMGPGLYDFHVKAANADGIWNEEGISVQLIVLPPWWLTWWAKIGWFIIGLTFLKGIFKWRVQNLHRNNKKLKVLVDQRTEKLEQQNIELNQLHRQKNQFFTNISHEFRTPLTLILGPVKNALESETKTLSEHHLHLISRAGTRLERMVTDLLSLARLQESKPFTSKKGQHLHPFLKQLLSSYSTSAELKNVNLKYSFEKFDIWLPFDTHLCEQIFHNLLSNAFKFSQPFSTIAVTTRWIENTKEAVISVRDEGIGIPENQLEYVFDRFYQVDGSSTRRHEGAGIGLALAKELTELQGGQILVESELNVGTTFTVILPDAVISTSSAQTFNHHVRLTAESGEAETAGAKRLPSFEQEYLSSHTEIRSKNKSTILIVEDCPDLRDYICGVLRQSYHLITAENGKIGTEMATEHLPDLIISDVMMPVLDGYDLCRILKQHTLTQHIPIVLLTALTSPSDKLKGLEVLADEFLCKPFSFEELETRIENLLEIRNLIQGSFHQRFTLNGKGSKVLSQEARFAQKIRDITEENLEKWTFGIDWLADAMDLSSRQLHRKMKDIFGLTPGGYIRAMRLKRSANLLEQNWGSVNKIAHKVGFQDVKYFSKVFRQAYGIPPSEYGDKNRRDDTKAI